jgi:hypothetical protein
MASNHVLLSMDCLGKADNQEAARRGNPTRDPTKPFGDTPTGSYHAHPFRWPTAPPLADRKKYGPHGWIAIDPQSGQALTAKINGRHGLLIHSGELRAGNLRPTFGCVRVTDEAMKKLLDLVRGPVDCTVVDAAG